MAIVDISHINKSYATKQAVKDISFQVDGGEIFGLIGPNGAGKTTTIRMMMDIIKPDSGTITVFGEKLGEATKNRLGYLPEERGLYRKLTVIDSIIYLASLKGIDPKTAEARADELLERTGMKANKRKKIDELSKGMSQLIQFIITVIHDPELLVLDEAFSGLDPVNTQLLKDLIIGLKDRGKAVIMSLHQMNQVEELCDRILMVDHGQTVLYGNLREIKSRFRSNSVILDYDGKLGDVPGVIEKRTNHGYTELILGEKTLPQEVLTSLSRMDIRINRFEVGTPSLNDIFIRVAGENHE
jgi:ABC-2 type transport system ATP-binding protein